MFSAILYNSVHYGDTRVSPSREETRDDLVGTMADRFFTFWYSLVGVRSHTFKIIIK